MCTRAFGLYDDFTLYVDSIYLPVQFFAAVRLSCFGDYASGTNHVLPTGGWVRSESGLSVSDFAKKISFQNCNATAFNYLAPTVMKLSELEQLDAHTIGLYPKEIATKKPRSVF